VSDENHALVLQSSENGPFEDFVCHLRVYRTQRIVQQVDIRVLIDSSSKTDSRLLSARNVDPSFSNYSFLAVGELKHIRSEAASLNSHFEALFVVDQSKCDVLLDGS